MDETEDNFSDPVTIRPNRRVFIWRPIVRRALLFAALALGLHFFVPLFVPADPGVAVWLAGAAVLVVAYGVNRWVRFRRTFYEFHDDRLVVKSGSIATRSTIDLPYRNVTQVSVRLPFIERRLFGTGHLKVHAAGSARGFAHLESIDEPRGWYDELADYLRDNGFSLNRDRQLQRESPHLVGTMLDTSSMVVAGLVALLTIGLTVGGAVMDIMGLQTYAELYDVLVGAADTDEPREAQLAFRGTLGLAVVAVLAATVGLAKVLIHFVDLNRRTYTLWDDVVDYKDGFLTETYRFVPIENLADTAIQEPFVKRLFGMADVTLSPHGSAAGIRFPSMPNAAKFRDHLYELIEATDQPRQPQPVDTDTGPASQPEDQPTAGQPTHAEKPLRGEPRSATDRRLPDEKRPALNFGPSYLRRAATGIGETLRLVATVAILLLLVALVVAEGIVDLDEFGIPADHLPVDWALIGVGVLAAASLVWQTARAVFFCATTNYRVGARKMSRRRAFISRDEVEFTSDKITTLVVERDLVDRLMGTATLTFWSIGNASPLVFRDICSASERIGEIRRRLGMDEHRADAEQRHRPSVGLLDALAGRLYSTVFLLALAAAAVIGSSYWEWTIYGGALIGAVVVMRVFRDLIYYPRCRMWMFDNHVQMRWGILFITEQYIPYDQIRSVATTRYPGRDSGTLRLVPGSSARASMRYLSEPRSLHEQLDDRLYDRPMRPVRQPEKLDRTEVSHRRPRARNSVVVAGVLTLSVAVVSILPALLLVIRARRTTIFIEEGRIRQIEGILYRTTQTVLLNRVDQLLMDRNPVNTLFDNGVVSVLTVGSTLPELRLGPVDDEQQLYDEIEQRAAGKKDR